MNKQIISLMCVAVCLALALVVANEKWPDGYRTAPNGGTDAAHVGAEAKGPVVLPEEKPVENLQKVTQQTALANNAKNASSDTSSRDTQKKSTQQNELVVVDSSTLKSDAPATNKASQSNSAPATAKKPAPPKKPEPEKKPEPDKTSASKPKATPPPKPAPKPEPKPEPKPQSKPAASLGKATAKILLYTREAVLEIKGDGPIRCTTFKLPSPDRLVVDLVGRWSVPVPTVPSNTIIQRVRVGAAPERTRIVLDLKRPLTVDKIVQVNASTINVRMQ